MAPAGSPVVTVAGSVCTSKRRRTSFEPNRHAPPSIPLQARSRLPILTANARDFRQTSPPISILGRARIVAPRGARRSPTTADAFGAAAHRRMSSIAASALPASTREVAGPPPSQGITLIFRAEQCELRRCGPQRPQTKVSPRSRWGPPEPRWTSRSTRPITLIEALSDIYEVVLVLTGRVGMPIQRLALFSGSALPPCACRRPSNPADPARSSMRPRGTTSRPSAFDSGRVAYRPPVRARPQVALTVTEGGDLVPR